MIDDYYRPHEVDVLCRRYMSLAKFIDLLSTRSLYFAALRTMPDKFEGLPPAAFERMFKEVTLAHHSQQAMGQGESGTRLDTEDIPLGHIARHICYVSCWSAGDHESDALWRLYCGQNAGIAVVSRFKAVRDALRPGGFAGQVRYVDHAKCECPDSNIAHFAMMKRSEFAYENEIRFVRWEWSQWPVGNVTRLDGIREEVAVDNIIQRVEVSPYAPEWYIDVVKAVVAKFEYTFDVVASQLSGVPRHSITVFRSVGKPVGDVE